MKKLYFSPILFLLVWSCTSAPNGTNKTDNTSQKIMAQPDTTLPPQASTTCYRLKLTREKYDKLRSYDKDSHVLVFQFVYSASLANPLPNLLAYSMKKNHKKINDTSYKFLDTVSRLTIPLTGPHQILGDLQATFKAFEEIKVASNQTPENYQYFLFSPKYDSINKHIIYTVKVVPTTSIKANQTLDLNPSPPYSAE